jgi:hypothetical protein
VNVCLNLGSRGLCYFKLAALPSRPGKGFIYFICERARIVF